MRLSLIILTWLSICSPGAFFVVAQNADEAAIKDVFVMFTKSWDEPGMPAFEDLFTDDADFVVITGRRLKGRNDIVTYHRDLLRTRYKGSRSLPMEVESVRFLAPDIAVAHVTSGARYLEDGAEVTRTGRATATLVRKTGTWRITAFHNTLTGGPGALLPKPPD
jgi:uncharacterized protein (TIGR02246 family)